MTLRFFWCAGLFLLGACTNEPPQDPVDPSYEHVETIMRRSCTFSSSCHGGMSSGQARLNIGIQLDECYPVTEALLRPAQEYPPMQRVAPGDPDHSYLMYKIDGAHDAQRNLIFTPDPAWVASLPPDAGRYILHSDGGALSFGVIMPQVAGQGMPVNDIISIREWIAAGALHPDMRPMCDAGPPLPDLGLSDTGPLDAMLDALTDASIDGGPTDASIDGGPTDASSDGGPTDASIDAGAMDGAMDGGAIDAGPMDGGVDGNG